MARLEEFFRKFARDHGVKIAEEVRKEAVRLSSEPYPPASQPGQPPKKRSGKFANSIRVVRTAHGARLVFFASHSSFLLRGTRHMAARPVHEIALQNVLQRRKGQK